MTEPTDLTHNNCLDRHHEDSPCEGEVQYRHTHPERYRANGTPILFPRCDRHYDLYIDRCEARLEREREYEASLYCKHGTYIGDKYGPDYLCGRCESE